MAYRTGSHTRFCHRFHVVWVTKYRYDMLRGELDTRKYLVVCDFPVSICQGFHILALKVSGIARFLAGTHQNLAISHSPARRGFPWRRLRAAVRADHTHVRD